ncbi:MAG: TIGR03621 family F420-dependent LLM class oxidoreductase [Actinomycetota bacterium]|nr:TIGR03621 family F420-dependent LLM class oxidoreductase [Actinomycetota bacterium]
MSPQYKFSIQLPSASDADDWVAKVKRAEALGFYSVSVPDHVGPGPWEVSPLICLAAAAMVTSRVRLATTVLNNDFRHPALLAKEIAMLDILSNGRVDMGIGAGWVEEDLTKTGIGKWDLPGVRVSRLFECIEALRHLFTGLPVNLDGDFYKIQQFTSVPIPLQDPLPIMMGGGGKRMLTYAAQNAQIISILTPMSGQADTRRSAFAEQLDWIRQAGGYEREDLTLGVRVLFGAVTSTTEGRVEAAARAIQQSGALLGLDELSLDELLDSPFGLIGSTAELVEHVHAINERYGITYFTVSEGLAWELGPLIAELC